MAMDEWIHSLGVKNYDKVLEDESVLGDIKIQCEEHVKRVKQFYDELDCHESKGLQKSASEFEVFCMLGCDPLKGAESKSRLFDEIIELNDKLNIQRDSNCLLKRNINSVKELMERYNQDTHMDLPKDIENLTRVLEAKQVEYATAQEKNKAHKDDVEDLFECIGLLKQVEELDSQLCKYHYLPPDLPDALSAIASAEAELNDLEEKRVAKLN